MNSDEEKRRFVPAAWKNGSLCGMTSGKLCYNHTDGLGLTARDFHMNEVTAWTASIFAYCWIRPKIIWGKGLSFRA